MSSISTTLEKISAGLSQPNSLCLRVGSEDVPLHKLKIVEHDGFVFIWNDALSEFSTVEVFSQHSLRLSLPVKWVRELETEEQRRNVSPAFVPTESVRSGYN